MRRRDKLKNIELRNKLLLKEDFNSKYLGDGNITLQIINSDEDKTISGKAELKHQHQTIQPSLVLTPPNPETSFDNYSIYYRPSEDKFLTKTRGIDYEVRPTDDQSRKWLYMLDKKTDEWRNSHFKGERDGQTVHFDVSDGSTLTGGANIETYGPNEMPVIKVQTDKQQQPDYIFYDEDNNKFKLAGRKEGANIVDLNNWSRIFMDYYKAWKSKNETVKPVKPLLPEATINLFSKLCGVNIIKENYDATKFGGKSIGGGLEAMLTYNASNYNYGDHIWDVDFGDLYSNGQEWCVDVDGELVPHNEYGKSQEDPNNKQRFFDINMISDVEFENINHSDAPDYVDAYVTAFKYDGEQMPEELVDTLNNDSALVHELLMKHLY